MMFQAAIFDMDGLLLDTERLCMRVFKEACSAQSLPFHEEAYLSMIGCNGAGIEAILRRAYHDDYPRVNRAWRERYREVVYHQAIDLKPGVITLLEWLKRRDVPIAVATSTPKETAVVKLRLAGLDHYFHNVTTGCEVTRGKPDPEIYLLAARRLGVDPQRCLAFEDSNNGARAAVGAGMKTYQVPDLVEPSPEVRALGHSIVESLSEALRLISQDATLTS